MVHNLQSLLCEDMPQSAWFQSLVVGSVFEYLPVNWRLAQRKRRLENGENLSSWTWDGESETRRGRGGQLTGAGSFCKTRRFRRAPVYGQVLYSIFIFLTIISHLALWFTYVYFVLLTRKIQCQSETIIKTLRKKWLQIVLGFVWEALRCGMTLWIVVMLVLSLLSCHQDRKWEVPWGLCPSFRYNLISDSVGRSP